MKKLTMLFFIVLLVSCKEQNSNVEDTPIVTVIKLKSAEGLLNFEEAKKYIDLQKVFKENPENQNIEEEWRKTVTFFHNIGNSKKFTNKFKYYNYNIIESIGSNKSKVQFIPINQRSQIKEIIYSLEFLDNRWKVVDIEHIN